MPKSEKIRASGGMIKEQLAPVSHSGNSYPAAEDATQLDVDFPLEREQPLPVQLHRLEYMVTNDSFRNCGINELRTLLLKWQLL